jgi:hypothetical protein
MTGMGARRHTPEVVRSIVLKYPSGMRAQDYADEMKISLLRAHEMLSKARREGTITKVGARNLFRYCVPETLAGAQAFYDAGREKTRLKHNAYKRAKRKAELVVSVRQAVRRAADATPLRVDGPRSVFDLGGVA